MAIDTLYIPAGGVLVATADASAIGTYSRVGEPVGALYAPAAIAASTVYTIGPFNEPRSYRFEYAGSISYSVSQDGVYTAEEEAEITALLAGKVSIPTVPASLGDIDTDASGTEIATAVNAGD